jgi:hypothetical protein
MGLSYPLNPRRILFISSSLAWVLDLILFVLQTHLATGFCPDAQTIGH